MKKKLRIFLIFCTLTTGGALFSQTAGTFNFSVTTTSTGGFSPAHLLVIWIENSSAEFIKTKIKYASSFNYDHLQTWVLKSGQDVADAITGPTLAAHGTVTFMWNGTNIASTVVPDGSYSVWLEMAWASSLTTGKTVNSYPFIKGSATFHSAPANTANFLSMTLDWIPYATGIPGGLENKELKVYPNPTGGLFRIEFKNPHEKGGLEILDGHGRILFSQKFENIPAGEKSFDLSGFTAGIYYCRLYLPEEVFIFELMLVK